MVRRIAVALNLPYTSVSRWTKLMSTFVAGQGAVQLIQIVSGFFLIRWLSVEEYAQYSVAFAFQNTAQMLVEFGFSGAIVALVGNRTHDKKVIGNYIKAGRFYRNRFFIVVGVGCLILFPMLTAKHQWPLSVTILLLLCILSNLYFSGLISYYSSPLKIHQKLGDLYHTQVKNGILRALLIAVFYVSSALNAWLAALSNSLLTIANGVAFRKKAVTFVEEPESASAEVRKEMFDYIRPIMPGIIFAAFQGQIMVFIISIFGQTESIAEVGALSRIGQLYVILNMAGGVLIAPYIAKQKKEGLFSKYISILGLYLGLAFCVVVVAYIFPDLFLWIIGSKYYHLESELVLLLITFGLGMINGVMWNMNASRKWIYRWMPMVSISGILIIQVACILFIDLSTASKVLEFSIITNLFVLLTRVLVSYVGFRTDK